MIWAPAAIVGAAQGKLPQALLVHEKHPAILAEGDGQVGDRAALCPDEQHACEAAYAEKFYPAAICANSQLGR